MGILLVAASHLVPKPVLPASCLEAPVSRMCFNLCLGWVIELFHILHVFSLYLVVLVVVQGTGRNENSSCDIFLTRQSAVILANCCLLLHC